jgi:hypothetical protein
MKSSRRRLRSHGSERQREAAAGHHGCRFERFVDIPCVVRRFYAPPPVAGEHRHHHEPRWQSHGDVTAAASPWPGRFAW